MKVKALNHIRQHVGSISVERVMGTVFDLDPTEAKHAAEAGLVELLEPLPKKVPKMETRQ